MDKDYQEAQERLRNLQREEMRLPEAIRSAAQAGNAVELVRLRQRKEELAPELFSAQVMVLKAHIAKLRSEQSAARDELAAARANSQKLDSEGAAALRVLDEERKRINTAAYSAATRAYELQTDINKRSHEIATAEKALEELLESAA